MYGHLNTASAGYIGFFAASGAGNNSGTYTIKDQDELLVNFRVYRDFYL
jgi:hypothetical protein